MLRLTSENGKGNPRFVLCEIIYYFQEDYIMVYNDHMTFKSLCQIFEKIERTSSRNDISTWVANLFKDCSIEEIRNITYFLQGRITPKYHPLEFSIGEKLILKTIGSYLQLEPLEVKNLYGSVGDMGTLVFNLISENKDKFESIVNTDQGLSINEIHNKLGELQSITGKLSTKSKSDFLLENISYFDPLTVKYFIRIILGNIGLGLSDKSIIDALSILCTSNKSIKDDIELAFGRRCDLGNIAMELKSLVILNNGGFEKYLKNLKIIPGIPISSKLVEREKNIEKVFERLGECYIQPKYDGLRCQIHAYNLENGDTEIKLYSRNLEEYTKSFPDVCAEVRKLFEGTGKTNMVLDGEIIGIDQLTGKFLQFGDTMKRKRKHSVDEYAKNIKVQVHVFDILYFKEDILETPIDERFQLLRKIFENYDDKIIKFSETIYVKSAEVIGQYFEKYVMDESLEGLIAKKPGTIYEPGTRNFDWIKLKRSSESTLNDTVDAVVIGYYFGKGSRATIGIGGILVGIYDSSSDEYLSLCKVGTGFKDEDFRTYKSQLDKIKADERSVQKYYSKIPKQLEPDCWVEPKITTEIEADEITISDLHSAGYSLRFPRIKKWNRDKDATQTTTVSELESMLKLRYAKS